MTNHLKSQYTASALSAFSRDPRAILTLSDDAGDAANETTSELCSTFIPIYLLLQWR